MAPSGTGLALPGLALPLPGTSLTLPGLALPLPGTSLALPGLALPGLALPGLALPGPRMMLAHRRLAGYRRMRTALLGRERAANRLERRSIAGSGLSSGAGLSSGSGGGRCGRMGSGPGVRDCGQGSRSSRRRQAGNGIGRADSCHRGRGRDRHVHPATVTGEATGLDAERAGLGAERTTGLGVEGTVGLGVRRWR
jgi:hypothetical protein